MVIFPRFDGGVRRYGVWLIGVGQRAALATGGEVGKKVAVGQLEGAIAIIGAARRHAHHRRQYWH